MRVAIRHAVLSSVLLAFPLLGACSSSTEPDSSDHEIGSIHQEIIGGVAATSAKLNAVGAVGFRQMPFDAFNPICTGTLISPTMVLTAKSCVNFVTAPATQLAFLIGPNARTPLESAAVKGFAVEDTVQGGVAGLGIDVAVVILAQPVTDVTPMPYAQMTPDKVGQRFTGLGYGIRDAHQTYGVRQAGSEVLQQSGGKLYQAIYGTFAKFLADAARYGLDPNDPQSAVSLQQAWDGTLLETGIEGWFGNGANDAQTCFGDTGGPIMMQNGGKTTVYGLASWVSWYDTNQVCELGAAYTMLEPIGLDFIAYQTACPLIPKAGACADLVTAARCIPPEEGGYRMTTTDCSMLGQICGLDDTGTPGCVDDPCDGIPTQGECNGSVATRCSHADEGARHVVTTDCSATGGTCSTQGGEAACTGGCAHDVCVAGSALSASSCGTCATNVCAQDPYCCQVFWDSICMSEVQLYCGGQSCPSAAAANGVGLRANTR
ncbi:MAG TPA: trypsin-like serine protease [Polyangiaceae bacterium]|jgi:hypothetical protein